MTTDTTLVNIWNASDACCILLLLSPRIISTLLCHFHDNKTDLTALLVYATKKTTKSFAQTSAFKTNVRLYCRRKTQTVVFRVLVSCDLFSRINSVVRFFTCITYSREVKQQDYKIFCLLGKPCISKKHVS